MIQTNLFVYSDVLQQLTGEVERAVESQGVKVAIISRLGNKSDTMQYSKESLEEEIHELKEEIK